MTDPIERDLRGIGADRPLPNELYLRLEAALLEDAERRGRDVDSASIALFEDLDGPRPVPSATRAAIERELTRAGGNNQRRGRVLLAVAAALVLVAGSVAIVRTGGTGSSHQVAARSVRSVPEAGVPPLLLAPTTTRAAPQVQAAAGAGAAGAGVAAPTTVMRSTTTTTWNCGLCSRNGAQRAQAAAGSPGAPANQPGMLVNGPSSVAPAQLSAVDPSSGPRRGGTIVTLTGYGFMGASGVLFGSSSAANFTVVSDTEIRVLAPASARAQTVTVAVAYPDGTTTATYGSTPQFTFT
ncbi:MAG: IPT/TIG domain-containing protein [Acidimicrobiia bacterium]|nr:IPT/TIG domain-containing protein [Acidimicrobiia bacterium]